MRGRKRYLINSERDKKVEDRLRQTKRARYRNRE